MRLGIKKWNSRPKSDVPYKLEPQLKICAHYKKIFDECAGIDEQYCELSEDKKPCPHVMSLQEICENFSEK